MSDQHTCSGNALVVRPGDTVLIALESETASTSAGLGQVEGVRFVIMPGVAALAVVRGAESVDPTP